VAEGGELSLEVGKGWSVWGGEGKKAAISTNEVRGLKTLKRGGKEVVRRGALGERNVREGEKWTSAGGDNASSCVDGGSKGQPMGGRMAWTVGP